MADAGSQSEKSRANAINALSTRNFINYYFHTIFCLLFFVFFFHFASISFCSRSIIQYSQFN